MDGHCLKPYKQRNPEDRTTQSEERFVAEQDAPSRLKIGRPNRKKIFVAEKDAPSCLKIGRPNRKKRFVAEKDAPSRMKIGQRLLSHRKIARTVKIH